MKNKVLVYDDQCPFCCWYTGLFVRTGMLPPEGRVPFSALNDPLLQRLDFSRSRNEIPLVDLQTGITLYGIDALLTILGSKMPLIQIIGNKAPVKWVLKKLYKLVSYNLETHRGHTLPGPEPSTVRPI